jgi:UDP-glucose 4-epimerase
MAGRRVFVSGVGGELGTLVAKLLEDEPWVGSLSGIDADPPRRRLQRTTFHRISPEDHNDIVDIVTKFNPHVLVHVGVWEPDARAAPQRAAALTDQAAVSVLGAAAECRALDSIIVRSGIEIYGRGPGSLTRPDEDAPLRPTSEWGRTVADIERTAANVAERIGVTVGAVRLASVLGPHVPSPLGLWCPSMQLPTRPLPSSSTVTQRAPSSLLLAINCRVRSTLSPPARSPASTPSVGANAFRCRCSDHSGGLLANSHTSPARPSLIMSAKHSLVVALPTTDGCKLFSA